LHFHKNRLALFQIQLNNFAHQGTMQFSKAIDIFIRWGQNEYTSKTIELYVDHLRRFQKFVNDKPIENVKLMDDVIKYNEHLKRRGLAENTINLSMIAIRQMYKLLTSMEREIGLQLPFLWGVIPVKRNILAKSHKPISIENYRKLLKAVGEHSEQTFKITRDETIIRILYDTGIRVSELTSLNISSLNLEDQSGVVITRKRRDSAKYRQVNWTRETSKVLMLYLDLRQFYSGSEALFINIVKGKRISTRSIERIIKDYCKQADIDITLVKPHSFRHGWGMRAAESQMYPPYLQAGLGHSNLNSSQVYYNVKNVALKKEYHQKLGDNSDYNNVFEEQADEQLKETIRQKERTFNFPLRIKQPQLATN
jgi:integrase/recombinase XerC